MFCAGQLIDQALKPVPVWFTIGLHLKFPTQQRLVWTSVKPLGSIAQLHKMDKHLHICHKPYSLLFL